MNADDNCSLPDPTTLTELCQLSDDSITFILCSLPTKFVKPPSSHLLCCICSNVYTEPVISVACGHTFCRNCILNSGSCPQDDIDCDASQVVSNRLVFGQIEELQIYCRHALVSSDDGFYLDKNLCKEIILYGARNEHENNCVYESTQCPNSVKCEKIPKLSLEDHDKVCPYHSCKNIAEGCTFQGTKIELLQHVKDCCYTKKTVSSTQKEIDNLHHENNLLKEKVLHLETENSNIKAELENQKNLIYKLNNHVEILSKRMDRVSPSHRKQSSTSSISSLNESGGLNSSGNSLRLVLPTHNLHRLSNSSLIHYENWETPFQFKCIGTFRGHNQSVLSLVTRKGRLYSSDFGGLIKVFSIQQLAAGCIENVSAHIGAIHCLANYKDVLISAGADRCIKMWQLNKVELTSHIMKAHDNTITAMVVVEDVLFTSSLAFIKAWDLKSNELKETFSGANHWVRALAVNQSKDVLYSGSHNAIFVWNIKDFRKLGPIHHDYGSVYALAVSETLVAAGMSGSYDKNIAVFDITTQEILMNLRSHFGPVTALVISPSGRFMFSGSHDSNIQVWNLENFIPFQTMSRHQGSVNALTLHGDYLISGSEDKEVKVFRYLKIQ